jgi:hypothetical protein
VASFYTNVYRRSGKVYLRGLDKGIRIKDVVNYTPYLFVPKKDGKYKTLEGKSVDKLDFDSISDARDYTQRYKDVSNFEFYGLTHWEYLYIYDTYKGVIDYDPTMVNVVSIDIETSTLNDINLDKKVKIRKKINKV